MKNNHSKSGNYTLVYCTLILILIGIVFISVSSIAEAISTMGDKFYFIKKQIIWFVLGISTFYLTSKIKINFFKKWSSAFYYLSLILLGIILLPQLGTETLGARRWLNLGIVGIQPSEIFKFFAIIFFSKLFSNPSTRNIKNLIYYLSIPIILIVLEPNLSTTILIIAIITTIYYVSGGETVSLFALSSCIVAIGLFLIFSSPYRLARFNSLINLDNPNKSTSYHSNQMILALTSGHLTGKGFANSDQKYRYLPKISTDSILAVIGEETGFIGVSIIIMLYIYLTSTIFKFSRLVVDPFESLLIFGIGCWISVQSLINISAVVGLIPLTGIPLPFISYGGSSLISLLAAIGLIQNILNNNPDLIYSNNCENKKNHSHHRHAPYASD